MKKTLTPISPRISTGMDFPWGGVEGACQLADSTLLGFAEPILQLLSVSGFDHAPNSHTNS
jgi:hypothetical protein